MASTARDDEVPLDVTRPFRRAAALKAGLTDKVLTGPLFRKILHGIYISAAVPRRRFERIEAALVFHDDDAFASHTSAARLWQLPIPERLVDEHVTVFTRTDRRERRGVRSHLAIDRTKVVAREGFRASPPVQVFLEMAGLLNLVELVALGDAVVASTATTPAELVAAAKASTDPHARFARRAAGFVRDCVDSRMESFLRMLIMLAGLPEPVVNHRIFDKRGDLLFRLDLCYPELRLIVEYDGRQHRDDLAQWDRDNDRDDYFDHHDWMIVRVFAWGIFRKPEKTLVRVQQAIRARGGRCPSRLRDDWRPFFPGRD